MFIPVDGQCPSFFDTGANSAGAFYRLRPHRPEIETGLPMLPFLVGVTKIIYGDAVRIAKQNDVPRIGNPLEQALHSGSGNGQKIFEGFSIVFQSSAGQYPGFVLRRRVQVVFCQAALP